MGNWVNGRMGVDDAVHVSKDLPLFIDDPLLVYRYTGDLRLKG